MILESHADMARLEGELWNHRECMKTYNNIHSKNADGGYLNVGEAEEILEEIIPMYERLYYIAKDLYDWKEVSLK